MSEQIIRQVLEAEATRVFNSLSPPMKMVFQNTAYTPKVGVPYAQCYVIPARTMDPSIGDRHSRRVGIFQISVFLNSNEGSKNMFPIMDAVDAAFFRGKNFEKNGKWVSIDSSPSYSQASVQNGWYVFHISIDYRMEVFR